MKNTTTKACFLLFLACSMPLSAAAQDSGSRSGFEAGVRLGYGVPLGSVSDDAGGDKLSDGIAGQVPLWLDLGYRLDPSWFLGLYTHYGIGSMGDMFDASCSGAVDCSATDVRLGVQVQYHVAPNDSLDPWLGLGFGYEWMTLAFPSGAADISSTISGFEFANLQAGLDFRAAEHVYIGPFLSFSLDHFSDVSSDCSVSAAAWDLGSVLPCVALRSAGIYDKALHEWLVLGIRGGYAP